MIASKLLLSSMVLLIRGGMTEMERDSIFGRVKTIISILASVVSTDLPVSIQLRDATVTLVSQVHKVTMVNFLTLLINSVLLLKFNNYNNRSMQT